MSSRNELAVHTSRPIAILAQADAPVEPLSEYHHHAAVISDTNALHAWEHVMIGATAMPRVGYPRARPAPYARPIKPAGMMAE